MSCRYLRIDQVLDRIPVSRATIFRWCAAGRFPKQVRLGPRCSAWLRREVDEWEVARAAERHADRSD